MTTANADQAAFWNSDPAAAWLTHQDSFDTLLSEALERLMMHAAPRPGERIVDVGCGTGASLLCLSDLAGAQGHVTGLDISARFLDRARERAAGRGNIDIIHGDAQTLALGHLQADLIFSRFGVMFFEDPVAAFENLRAALRPGGRIAMLCWQGAPENPWFMEPMQAAMARLGKPDPMDPHAPGPMAFKDMDRVTGILGAAGWTETDATPVEVDLIPPQTLDVAADFATSAGPATRLLREREGTPDDVAAIRADCAHRFARFQTDGGLRIPARLIVYSARRPDP